MEQATGSPIPTLGPRVVLASVIPGPSSATTSSTQPSTTNPTAATLSTQLSTAANLTVATPDTQLSTANSTAATPSTWPSTLTAAAATAEAASTSSGAGNTVAGKCLTCIFCCCCCCCFFYAVLRVGDRCVYCILLEISILVDFFTIRQLPGKSPRLQILAA